MTSHPNHLQDSGAELNALDALSSIGADIALWASYAIILIAPLGDDMSEMEFEHEEWLRVIADSAESARVFFGAPKNWPVKFGGFDSQRVGRVWLVRSEGLTIK